LSTAVFHSFVCFAGFSAYCYIACAYVYASLFIYIGNFHMAGAAGDKLDWPIDWQC